VEANTLYPLLRRLEKQELLISKWDVEENRPRKYYVLSKKGENVYQQLKVEWEQLSTKLNKLLKEEENNESN
jgi:DNA-binding PadR family transcriptional regulator